jgi:HK97 family phage major capsid protein
VPTPCEAEQLLRDEQSIEARKLRFARELDEAKEERFLRRNIRGQLEAAIHPGSGMLPTIQALTPHEHRNYSIGKLVADMVRGTKDTTLEREVSWSIQKDLGMTAAHGGHLIPLRMSGLDTKTNSSGGFLTAPKVNDVIDYLINQSKVLSLGARFLSGLKYSQQFPTEDSPLQTSWVNENPQVDVTAIDVSFGVRSASPHALQSSTSASRQLLTQASPSLETWLKSRIARGHALAIDLAAINGSGDSNQPLGLLKTQGIGDVPIGASGGSVTAAHILSLEDATAALAHF